MHTNKGEVMVGEKFQKLYEIMRKLREECPWDMEQTHDSIKAATLEETYELIEAIDQKDYQELKAELGDLLLHIVFHSAIGEDNKTFNTEQVIDSICEKLIRRHPHVFGDVEVKDTKEILKNWEEIKLTEGRESVLEGVPKQLPGLARAYRLQEKASKVGFDWEKKEDVWKKVIEEIEEMHEMEAEGNMTKLEEEFGDVFFALTNYARFLGINPENALRLTNEKFTKRFSYVEKKITGLGKKLSESNLTEMDKYWEESKKYD
ncbi:MAG: nucleoside triphosphate pyrophosphohydrolase [Stygiobacter sp. RIFOXYC12_FULL_38_8]|nr:MAG: nucleoside triphosphate pyrophosphohydrolase [Stygiobacter sp. GWC2_38_9]OGU77288.1 MAG: nucleoside triphosphate pyrophosphohydrolase [Stygiobacter sp. RIFOXYA12_FULL_38_9]OGV09010.1 MAG: nucleoside triphosphate pyrophosphohydrolase [Stygiobacter sp. RIFOXYB2_FULL_37_11]OGV14173.1 MAG: nucleoside triphosphate pyrophosphohydrolase [Stygiobacter sp. RIFOXYA2_FULL_38_8]OGV16235.1 MAG: nucleoside triphosphate pyrophosphohydrolase [Stygiobacter sp. RIFOXYC2_FULL_38_25]OGV25652.1 MAG: nucleo